ncbi:MAG: alpha/beta fold hydrolase [Erythrobacter sp.]
MASSLQTITRLFATTALAATAWAMPGTAAADPGEQLPASLQGTTMTISATAAPLIPRTALFGNPTRAQSRVSPDGKWLSWSAPHNGVMNVWVAPISDPAAARLMTQATERPIPQYFWAPDSRSLLYVQDKDGDENYLLYRVDLASGAETTLTPFENTRVEIIGTSHSIKDKMLIGLNNRDPQLHDIYLLDIGTGALTMVMKNTAGYAGGMADDTLTMRMVFRQNMAGGIDYFRVTDNVAEETPFESVPMEDALTTSAAGYSHDGKLLYWLDSRGRDTAALFAQDTATGTRTLIAEDPRADISDTLRDPATGRVQAYAVNYLTENWVAFDPAIKASLDWLESKLEGRFGINSRSDDDSKWIVFNDPITAPTTIYIYDRKASTLTPFYVSRPELAGMPLQKMHPVEITARDGLTLPSYLTLPVGSDKAGTGIPEKPVPLVLLVHGGPWARDYYGFNREHQLLANRGYAVLAVNYRSSTGFGKDFLNAGNKQWGLAMHDDLIDAVNWAIAKGITTPDKVAIMGGSYGGYATLAGLTFTPDTFACGVDIVGPSNLETLLATIPPYWAPLVKQFHERMGDPNTPEGLALLRAASPLHKADQIKRPLLIAQGANDPRVKQSESDQIVAAMKAAKIPVTYVLYPDEGHGFARPENNIAFYAIAENFLATCLGGRAEPIGDALKPSTAQIVEGAEYVKGLKAALAK